MLITNRWEYAEEDGKGFNASGKEVTVIAQKNRCLCLWDYEKDGLEALKRKEVMNDRTIYCNT
jgi:hypothetical protein